MMHTNNSSFLILFIVIGIFVVIEIINLYSLFVHRSTKKKKIRIIIRIIISACIFLFICFLIFALIWLTPRKSREYIKSDEYYEANIEDINVNDVCFRFLQVNEVPDLEDSFYRKYDSYESIQVGNDSHYLDIFEKYTNLDMNDDQEYVMRYFLDNNGYPVGARFSFTSHEPNAEAHTYVSIDACVTDEPLEEYEDLLPYMEQADEEHIYSVYDNIFYYMEGEENMDLFQTSICTAIFDGSRYYYFHHDLHLNNKDDLNNYCRILYELLNNYQNCEEDFS